MACAFLTDGISDEAASSLNRFTILVERSSAWMEVTEGPRAREIMPVPHA